MTASQAKWLADTVEFRDFHRCHSYPVNANLCNLDVEYSMFTKVPFGCKDYENPDKKNHNSFIKFLDYKNL